MEFTTILALLILVVGVFIAFWIGLKIGSFRKDREWGSKIPDIRKDAAERSRAVIGGQFSEQLAPYLPNFNYKPTECRFIGKPIDFLVFKGMDDKEIEEVVFIEVKSGDSKLSTPERRLRDAIKEKNVRWEEYRIPKKLTD